MKNEHLPKSARVSPRRTTVAAALLRTSKMAERLASAISSIVCEFKFHTKLVAYGAQSEPEPFSSGESDS
ncbi:hypothetical protein [Ancylobacter mangrovi]|uniref:hypothetical protein n=1 Tax=Ancylobacter mangrovi TaxID=2972472 RepID=UPI002162ACBD|nr:hypothetical protein [Ancylobacter mangrovi]MCS0502773.1 hypothetical protein [Ancylobacter mangrovi]